MSRSWTVEIPHPDAPLTPNRRRHWRVYQRAVKDVRARAWEEFILANIPRIGHAHLELRVTPPDRRRRDSDNWVPYLLKPIKDAVVDAGILPDDTPEHCTWQITPVPANGSKRWRYVLVITERGGDDE